MSIIQKYSNKNIGIRSVKDCLRTILLKVNTLKLLGKQTIKKIGLSFDLKEKGNDQKDQKDQRDQNYSFPIIIDESNVDVFLGSCNKIDVLDDTYLSMYM